ncbi:hypothetical protein Tco_0879743 [Tanacetum coccineum]
MKALFYDPLIYNDNDVDVVENVDLAEGVTASEEVVNDEIEIEDIYEFVGSEQVVEEDVVIPNIGLNDRFLNKLVNYKYISDKDVGANLGINSSSSRDVKVEDSSVDNIYKVKEGVSYHVHDPNLPWNQMIPFVKECMCSNKKGKQNVDESICTPNSKSMSKAKQIKSSKSKSKSNSPKTPELPKTPKSSKTPKVTHNTDASQKVDSKAICRRSVKHPRISYRLMKADVRDKEQILATNPCSSVHLDVDTMDDEKTQFKRMYIYCKAMKDGWRGSCRRVMRLDGCFLYATCRGELLTAMRRYANNQMFLMS